MTIQVIDTVVQPDRRFVCQYCGSVLSFADSDVKINRSYDINHDYCERHTITCPKCGRWSLLWEND